LFLLLILVIAIVTATLWQASRREAQAVADYPPIGQFVDVDGHPVHAVVMGDGPDLVLIHGASGNVRDMTFSLAPKLAERYRVILFDRPGLGHTPLMEGDTLQAQATLLQKAAAKLGAERPLVMGQSYGGGVALAWAVHHPDNLAGLIPVAAASNPWDTPLSRFYKITSSTWGSIFAVPLLTAWVPVGYVDNTLASIFAPDAVPDGYGAHVGTGLSLRRSALRANAQQRKSILDEIKAQVPLYGTISVPVEILHGTGDDTVSPKIHSEVLVTQIKGANLILLDGIGHMPHHAATDQVIAAIDRAAMRAGLR
jgi:pimeloyl-ACP methyl ester carboxylesterase